jgi:hypothetical protein
VARSIGPHPTTPAPKSELWTPSTSGPEAVLPSPKDRNSKSFQEHLAEPALPVAPQRNLARAERAERLAPKERMPRPLVFQEDKAAPKRFVAASPQARPEREEGIRAESRPLPKRSRALEAESPSREAQAQRLERSSQPVRSTESSPAPVEKESTSVPQGLPRGNKALATKDQEKSSSVGVTPPYSRSIDTQEAEPAPMTNPMPGVIEAVPEGTIPLEALGLAALNESIDPSQLPIMTALPLEWQQQIQTHVYIQGGMDALLQESPALALLSGHLEHLIPAEIPTIVAQTPLLQKIVASGDLKGLFAEIQTLGQQLKDLGLDDSSLAMSLESMGRDSWGVNLQDVLKALGLDPEKLMQEAARLKQVLPDQGLQPYMLKAAKLRAQMDNGQLAGLAALAWPLAGNPRAVPLDVLTPESNVPVRDVSLEQPSLDRSLMPSELEGATLWGASEDGQWLGAFAANDASPMMLGPLLHDSTQTLDPHIPISQTVRPDASLMAQGMPLTAALDERPLVRLDTQDPFARIADSWIQEDVKSIDFSSTQTELLQATPSGDLMMAMIEGQENAGASLTNTRPTEATRTALPLQALASLMDLESGDGQDSSFESQSGEGRGFSESPSSSPFNSPSSTPSTAAPNTFQLQNTAAPAAAQRLPQEALQQIFDRASMMVKEGGGSIRVDLGSEDLGTIDLALDIQGNTIDLRISATSPHARDLLAQELPRLRESLQQQNLNLERVEVGLSGGSAWSQSGDGRSSRGQNYEQLQENTYRGPSGIRDVRSYRQSSRLEALDPQHAGMIQVRV